MGEGVYILGLVRSKVPWLAVALLGIACSEKDRETARIRSRAEALRYFPLPERTAVPGPPGVYVNSKVPQITVFSTPSGAELTLDGRSLGKTPCVVRTADLMATEDSDGSTPWRLRAAIDGASVPIERYLLRFEAVVLNVGVNPESLPRPLPGPDLWFYLVLGAPAR
jgi:PEGA domain-containing protein